MTLLHDRIGDELQVVTERVVEDGRPVYRTQMWRAAAGGWVKAVECMCRAERVARLCHAETKNRVAAFGVIARI